MRSLSSCCLVVELNFVLISVSFDAIKKKTGQAADAAADMASKTYSAVKSKHKKNAPTTELKLYARLINRLFQ